MSEQGKNTLETEVEVSKEVGEVGEKIEKWNVGKISELIEWIKKKFNIQEQAVVQTAASAQSEEKVEKKGGNVSVKWVKMEKDGVSIVPILGDIVTAVKSLEGKEINKLQAKKLAEGGEQIILNNIPRDKAEIFQKEMKNKQAEVEIVEIK